MLADSMQNRRTDDPFNDDRSDSFSINEQSKPAQKAQPADEAAAGQSQRKTPLLSLNNSFEEQRDRQAEISKQKRDLASSAAHNVVAAAECAPQPSGHMHPCQAIVCAHACCRVCGIPCWHVCMETPFVAHSALMLCIHQL